MALPDTFDKLKELLTQDQFELLLDEEKKEENEKAVERYQSVC